MQKVKLKLIHAFGSTCSRNYKNVLAICDQQKNQPKIVFPAGKTLARKYIDRTEMDFIQFSEDAESIESMIVLPMRTDCAVVQKPFGSNLQIIKIYPLNRNCEPRLIKIFSETDKVGTIKQIIFSASEPKFMCAQIGQPHNKLLFIDTFRNKPLAESNFTIKEIEKLTICPQNSHLICLSGGSTLKLYKIQEYAFKPLQEVSKFPKNRKITEHSWHFAKKILAATDKCEILIIEEIRPNIYEVREEYHNVFNQLKQQQFLITCICPFTRGFILGSSTGKFCLWTKKENFMNNSDSISKFELTRKWSTTAERASGVTEISINKKQDLLLISMASNDIALLYLNEIIPQVSDLIMEISEKQINFQYLYKGFHSKAITGMDVCQQRPLFATCSNQDSTIRIWNYKSFGCKLLRMFYFKIKTDLKADRPLITLTFHPSGYYMAVGCTDKLRIFHVLNNQLRPFKEVGIKNVHKVKFSNGGHLLAVGHQFSENHEYDLVRIYNALTLQELISFKETQSIVKNLQWKSFDDMLNCIFENGTFVQYKVSDWSVVKRVKKQLTFEASAFNHPANSTLIYAQNPKSNINSLEEYFENNLSKSINIDMKITSMLEVQIKKQKSHFLLALQNGTIVTFSGIDSQSVSSRHNHHVASISQMVISPCGNYVITCGSDALIFIYQIMIFDQNHQIRQPEFTNTSSVVDDFLSDVVLVSKKQIAKYTQKEKQFTKVISNLSKKLKILSEDGEKKHQKNLTELETQKNRIIDDIKHRLNRVKEQIELIKSKNKSSLGLLDSNDLSQAQNLEKNFEQKISFEAEKYFQLEQELIQLKVLHKKKLQSLHQQQQTQISSIKLEFQSKFKELEQVFTQTKQQNNDASQIFQQRLSQIEQEQEEEVRELAAKKQKFKLQAIEVLQQFNQKLQKMKKQYATLDKQKTEVKNQHEELIFQKTKIQKELAETNDKLKNLMADINDKLESLKNKEKKISQFQEKITDLQKKKHILSYKATQMKKAIEPKDYQIQKLKSDLIKLKKEFESSLERKQKANLYLEKMNKEKEYMEKCFNEEKNRTYDQTNLTDDVLMDIYSCLQKNNHQATNQIKKQEPAKTLLGGSAFGNQSNSKSLQPLQINSLQPDNKIYFKQLIKIYHKYVQSSLQNPSGRTLDQNNDKNIGQVTKQIVHLEKSLFQINKSNEKTILRKNDEIFKRTKENTELINNLNQLKKQNKELIFKIKSKNIEIENLNQTKNQLLNNCSKQRSNLMFKFINGMNDNLLYNSQKKASIANQPINNYSNKPLNKEKSLGHFSAKPNLSQQSPGLISKQSKKLLLSLSKLSQNQDASLKKKQCEILSEIEFINQKVHKYEFYLNDMLQKLRKHTILTECNKIQALLSEQELD